jgi:hypothetical protein
MISLGTEFVGQVHMMMIITSKFSSWIFGRTLRYHPEGDSQGRDVHADMRLVAIGADLACATKFVHDY